MVLVLTVRVVGGEYRVCGGVSHSCNLSVMNHDGDARHDCPDCPDCPDFAFATGSGMIAQPLAVQRLRREWQGGRAEALAGNGGFLRRACVP